MLALVAAALIVAFNANVTRLIQLYILGVFLSFTLSQAGMVRHWARELAGRSPASTDGRSAASRLLNGAGAVVTGLVFVIVLVTKFAAGRMDRRAGRAAPLPGDEGRCNATTGASNDELRPTPSGVALPGQVHAVVLVSNLLAPTLRALAFAQATAPGHASAR